MPAFLLRKRYNIGIPGYRADGAEISERERRVVEGKRNTGLGTVHSIRREQMC